MQRRRPSQVTTAFAGTTVFRLSVARGFDAYHMVRWSFGTSVFPVSRTFGNVLEFGSWLERRRFFSDVSAARGFIGHLLLLVGTTNPCRADRQLVFRVLLFTVLESLLP